MRKQELTDYMDDLLNRAIQKCDYTYDAQELVQETMLAALTALDRGIQIEYPKTWLLSVMNHKYYDCLRRKYKMPVISFDVMPEEMAIAEEEWTVEDQEEAQEIRRSLAFLAGIYREAIIRYYMKNESIAHIASSLGLPENTVKSRLFIARKQMKKELEMNQFEKQSYEPDALWMCCCGDSGLNGEPFSLVKDDRITMNLLILAYEKPVTVSDLAKKIGIPCAYIEPVIRRLLDGELMRKTGDKVYTDFIIYSEHDRSCNMKAEKEMADRLSDEIWKVLSEGIEELRQQLFYQKQRPEQREKLESYFGVRTMIRFVMEIGNEKAGSSLAYRDYPERPNGGKWIAMGNHFGASPESNVKDGCDYESSGEAGAELMDYHGTPFIFLGEYDTSLGRTHHDYTSREVMKYPMESENVLKMLYAVHYERYEDFDVIPGHCMEQMEAFEHMGYVIRDDKMKVALPVITEKERQALYALCERWKQKLAEKFRPEVSQLMKSGVVSVPKHLKSVPEFLRYMFCAAAFPMMVLLRLKEEGVFLPEVQHACPAAYLVIDE